MYEVRTAVLENNKKTSIITIVLFLIIVALEAFFLYITLTGNSIAVEAFAPIEFSENVTYNNNNLYDKEDFFAYTIPQPIYEEGIPSKEIMVALTFDDGPSSYTSRLLEILKKYNAKATFFMVGDNVGYYPDVIKQLLDYGCEVGTHTQSHANLNASSNDQIDYQIGNGKKVIEDITGQNVKFLRPPYGNKNQTVIDICQSKGLSLILWNVDTEDWKSRNTDTIVNKFLNDTDDGDIVLMHDIYGTTIDAVEILLERLTKKGYHFVTVSELYKYKKGISLEPGKAYYGM